MCNHEQPIYKPLTKITQCKPRVAILNHYLSLSTSGDHHERGPQRLAAKCPKKPTVAVCPKGTAASASRPELPGEGDRLLVTDEGRC